MRSIGEACIAKPGADGQHAPVLHVPHGRCLAQPLHDRVVVHDHHGPLASDRRQSVTEQGGQVEAAALPATVGQILTSSEQMEELSSRPAIATGGVSYGTK